MTVVKETATARWIGDTADAKPTGVPVGSTYLDRQTGTLWVCYDGTNWAEKASVPGTGATSLGKAEDAAHTTGDVGVMALAVRKNTAVALGADGDYMPVIVDTLGRVHVTPSGSQRNTGVLHRNAITSVDKIADFVDASVTLANVAGTQGFLNFNTAYYMTAIPGNRWGPCKVNTNIDTLTTTNDAAATHVIACTIAQATGAEWYDLFLSTDAAPKWVGRITEAQRAAGGEILTLATITAGASAGVFNIGAVGTGVASSNTMFSVNNAYRPATVTAINCAGYTKASVKVKLAVTDLRSAPTLTIVPFFGNQVSATDFHMGSAVALSLLSALGTPLCQEFALDVNGETSLTILIGTISGQGAAMSCWVELS